MQWLQCSRSSGEPISRASAAIESGASQRSVRASGVSSYRPSRRAEEATADQCPQQPAQRIRVGADPIRQLVEVERFLVERIGDAEVGGDGDLWAIQAAMMNSAITAGAGRAPGEAAKDDGAPAARR